ncbi:cytochrome c oxidase subunit 3 [Rubinisphaera margarita]|uniref:cytochrome c oxidase subunit 3 n=1 Tax=Rubinisphaera margarita TaxID=2909586 RepID=UPI001EE8A066|nr:cytochrome c oxidase subunit 3 [Rubinisphaera margarita]MCG6157188.1 cytochrome c oxidase subunit 3 [Rubinisphaera margarita]
MRTRVYPEFAKTTYLVYGLIGSITIFFVAAFIAYLTRYIVTDEPPLQFDLPPLLLVNTVLLLTGSHLLFRAYRAIRRERQQAFRIYLTSSLVLACVFCLLQAWGMGDLLEQHWQQQGGVRSAAAIFLMVFLHVAHFIAGLCALFYVTVQGYRGRYDHEFNNGVRLAAVYWRFLDVIWLLMLGLFLLTGRV